MTRDPAVVQPDTTVGAAALVMRNRGVSMLPVVADSASMRLVGVITDRDIVERCLAEGHTPACAVHRHMTTAALEVVHAADDVEAIQVRMNAGRVHRVPVVDDSGAVVGVVSLADLARRRAAHATSP